MIDEPKITAAQFLEKVTPQTTGELTLFPSKEQIFTALFDARGTNLSLEHLPPASNDKNINATRAIRAKMDAVRAKFKISSNSRDVTDSHFIDVAMDSYIRGGGKYENFVKEYNLQREEYRFAENRDRQARELAKSAHQYHLMNQDTAATYTNRRLRA